MMPRLDRSETPGMCLGSARRRRWVSVVIAIAVASRLLLPVHDGEMVMTGGRLVPVCTVNGLKFVPAQAPERHSGAQAACVHGLAAISCLEAFLRPASVPGDAVQEGAGVGVQALRSLSPEIRDRRARDPPRELEASLRGAAASVPC